MRWSPCAARSVWTSSRSSRGVSRSFREQRTTDEVIERAVAGCDAVLTVLVPRGVHHYSSGTAQAVLDHARPGARLVFSCGYHITRDGQDVYSWKVKALVNVVGRLARLVRLVDLDDQVEACRRIFASDTRWTVVRGSDLEEGEPQGLPVWSRHVGDPILESNLTRRVDFARFMVEAIENDELVHEAPAIVGCQTPSALAHAANGSPASAMKPSTQLRRVDLHRHSRIRRAPQRRMHSPSCSPGVMQPSRYLFDPRSSRADHAIHNKEIPNVHCNYTDY